MISLEDARRFAAFLNRGGDTHPGCGYCLDALRKAFPEVEWGTERQDYTVAAKEPLVEYPQP